MKLVHLLPLLLAIVVAWLVVRAIVERRSEGRGRERLKRAPRRAKAKARDESERSQMRAGADATTVASTLQTRPRAASTRPASDGTRSTPEL